MPAEPLATISDLTDRLGRDLTDTESVRAPALLTDASATVRNYTGQWFTAAETTAKFKVRNGRIRLPQYPVTAVTSVEYSGTAVAFVWDGFDYIDLDRWPYPVANGPTYPRLPYIVDVVYEHGYEFIPDDVVAVTCSMTLRALGLPAEDAGMESEHLGAYGYTRGAAAAQGAIGMLAGERAVLDRYRRPAGPIRTDGALASSYRY